MLRSIPDRSPSDIMYTFLARKNLCVYLSWNSSYEIPREFPSEVSSDFELQLCEL